MKRSHFACVVILIASIAGSTRSAEARITRIVLTRIESPTFAGVSFGDTGPYKKLVGRAFGEVDPNDPRNAVITDIALAPRNARGMVEYSTDLYILTPVDSWRGNHNIFFELNNRGSSFSFGLMNDATTGGNDPTTVSDAGNGFLMRQGYTIVLSGWDVTVAPGAGRFTMTVPVAKNPDGSSIVGPSLEEFVIDNSHHDHRAAHVCGGDVGQDTGQPHRCGRTMPMRRRQFLQRTGSTSTPRPFGSCLPGHPSRTAACTNSRISPRIRSSRGWASRGFVISPRSCVTRSPTMSARPTRWLATCGTSTHSVFRSRYGSCTTSCTWASTRTNEDGASLMGTSTGSEEPAAASSTTDSPNPGEPTANTSHAGIPRGSSLLPTR